MRAGGPRIESLDNVQYGLHYAIVTQNKDPDNLNRVKVRFPWLDGGDTDESHWAQLMTPMEGNKFGWYTLPDIEDVVVVAFIAGDMSHPVVIGGVWSTPDNAPEPNEDGKNNFRGFRSRAGSRLILDDSSKSKVVLADKDGKNVVGIGEFTSDGAGPNVCGVFTPPMAGKSGISISTLEGTLEITCTNGKLLVDAGDSIKINAKTTIEVKAGTDITLEGNSAGKLTSGSPSNYDAAIINID